jgi:hypothetical protein
MVQVNLRLDEVTLGRVDAARGLVPRNAWLRRAVEYALGGNLAVLELGTANEVTPVVEQASPEPVEEVESAEDREQLAALERRRSLGKRGGGLS